MFGQTHPLRPLANIIDILHSLSENSETCDEEHCAVQRILQENSSFARKIMAEIAQVISNDVQESSSSPLTSRQEAHLLSGSLPAAEAIRSIKIKVASVTRLVSRQWGQKNKNSDLRLASDEILSRLEAVCGLYCSPEMAVTLGFHTAVGFIGNVYQLSCEVLRMNEGDEAVTPEKVSSIAKNSFNLVQLIASCRKDIFMQIQGLILTANEDEEDRYLLSYAPELFTLVGSESEGTRQLSIRPTAVVGAIGTMHGLTRQQCPSMGETLRWFLEWQRQLYETYFVANVRHFRES